MLNYIKSVISSFFSSSSTIVFVPIVEEDEPKVKKTLKKKASTKKKPKARSKAGRKPIYPYRDTPVGGGFRMKNQMNGDIYRTLQEEGIYYSQHKVIDGVLAYRTA